MEIVLQGLIYPETLDIIKYYLSCRLIDRIVVSCWEPDPDIYLEDSKMFSEYWYEGEW